MKKKRGEQLFTAAWFLLIDTGRSASIQGHRGGNFSTRHGAASVEMNLTQLGANFCMIAKLAQNIRAGGLKQAF